MADDPKTKIFLDQSFTDLSAINESLNPEQFRRIVENSPNACLILDGLATVLYSNQAAEMLFKYSKNDFLSLSIAHLFRSEDDRENIFDDYVDNIAKGTAPRTFIGKTISKNGDEIYVRIEWLLLHNRKREVCGATAIISNLGHQDFKVQLNDISELFLKNRKDLLKATSLIQQERDMAQRYLSIANVMITIVDTNINTAMINKAGCDLLGYREEEIVGKNWIDQFIPEDEHINVKKEMKRIFSSEETISSFENKIKTKDNRELIILWNNTILKDLSGNILGILSSGQDISKMRNDEKELIRAKAIADEANKAKSQFLAEMSHEIRNPLNSIIGVSDLLLETNLSPEQKEYVEIFNRSSQTLLSLVNEILDLSKIESNKITVEKNSFAIDDLIENILILLREKARQKGITFVLKIGDDVPRNLIGDSSKIHQILLNLIGNSLKFTDSGSITVKVDYTSINPNKTILQFEVIDSGIGIEQEKIDSLFSAFTQLTKESDKKYGGTGLGLSIAKRLVEILDGEISVESKVGMGSTFRFLIPLQIDTKNPFSELQKIKDFNAYLDQSSSKETRGENCNCNILIVDDSSDNRTLIKAFLKKSPFKTLEATDGKEALKMFKEQSFDMILMDAQMPVLDGYEATTQIREWEKKIESKAPIPIVMISAYAFESEIEKSKNAGSNFYLTKPIKKEALLDIIHQACSEMLKHKSCKDCQHV
jgi:PAS domain S-box-containing protein